MRILIDMDDTILDFVGPAAALWGKTRADLEAHWVPGEWDMIHPLAKCLRADGIRAALTVTDFWARIEAERGAFWERLPALPWMDELIDVVQAITNDWHIVSSPARCPTCHDGKVRWLKKAFGSSFDRFALTPHKHIFAGPNVVLVDDRDANEQAFNAAGGRAILLPRLHNALHWMRDDPMPYVRQALACAARTEALENPRQEADRSGAAR